jgi:hypothetical protein
MKSRPALSLRRRRLAVSFLAVASVASLLLVQPANGSGSSGPISWSDAVVGQTTNTGFAFGSNCTSSRGPNVAEEAATAALIAPWASQASGLGNSVLSPVLAPAAGASGDAAAMAVAGSDLTVTVSRRQVTPASALSNVDGSTGSFSTGASFSSAQRLQDCAPRPADLSAAPAGMTLAAPAALSGSNPARSTFWNATTFPSGNQLDAALFEFSRPVASFGAWFGDLESRHPGAGADGVLARVKVLAADGTVIAAADVLPEESPVDDVVCGGPDLATDGLGCGNQATRFVGFNLPTANAAALLVIVGDDDSCAQTDQCDAITEYLSWVGAVVAEAPEPEPTTTTSTSTSTTTTTSTTEPTTTTTVIDPTTTTTTEQTSTTTTTEPEPTTTTTTVDPTTTTSTTSTTTTTSTTEPTTTTTTVIDPTTTTTTEQTSTTTTTEPEPTTTTTTVDPTTSTTVPTTSTSTTVVDPTTSTTTTELEPATTATTTTAPASTAGAQADTPRRPLVTTGAESITLIAVGLVLIAAGAILMAGRRSTSDG